MPRNAYRRCRVCNRHWTDVGPLSWTRLCGDCARDRLHTNMDGIHFHDGPAFDRWRRANVAAFVSPAGMALLDSLGEFGTLDASQTAA